MDIRRQLLCLLFTVNAAAMAQTPSGGAAEIPPGPVPPATAPDLAGGVQTCPPSPSVNSVLTSPKLRRAALSTCSFRRL